MVFAVFGNPRAGATQDVSAASPFGNVELPFIPTGVSLSPDGKRGVAWHYDHETKLRISVIDAETPQVRLTRTLNVYQPFQVVTDGNLVVVSDKSRGEFAVFSCETLEPINKFSCRSGGKMQVVENGKYLAVNGNYEINRARATKLHSLPDIGEVGTVNDHLWLGVLPSRFRTPGFWLNDPLISVVENIRVVDGVGYEPNLKDCTYRSHLPFVGYRTVGRDLSVPTRWNRSVRGRGIYRPFKNSGDSPKGEEVRTLNNSISSNYLILLEDHPVGVHFSWEVTVDGRNGSVSGRVSLIELVRGKVVTEYSLEKIDIANARQIEVNNPSSPIASAGNRMILAMGNRVYSLGLNGDELGDRAKFPEPVSFIPRQSTFHLNSTETATLKHQVTGGVAPFEFGLTNAMDSMEINSETGDLIVDGPALTKSVCLELFGYDTETGELIPGEQKKRDRSGWRYRSLANNEFEQPFEMVTGTSLEGFPATISVEVQVTDAEGDLANMGYVVALEIPEDVFEQALESLDNPPEIKESDSGSNAAGDPGEVTPTPLANSEKEKESKTPVIYISLAALAACILLGIFLLRRRSQP